jgi:hypothetical protein
LDSIKDAEQIWGYYDKYYYNHPWGKPESYPGAPGAPSYGYGGYGGYGHGRHGHGGEGEGGGYSGGYSGYGGYGRRYAWDDRGEVDRGGRYGGGSDIKNKDWWNYLTKDNGESGMVPIHLNRTQLEEEGMYDAIYWEEHGMKDD